MTTSNMDKMQINWLLSSAHAYLLQNMSSQAITILELLDSFHPNHRQTLRMLAYAYLLAKEFQKTIEKIDDLNALGATETTNGEEIAFSRLLRAQALWGLGKSADAKTELTHYIAALR